MEFSKLHFFFAGAVASAALLFLFSLADRSPDHNAIDLTEREIQRASEPSQTALSEDTLVVTPSPIADRSQRTSENSAAELIVELAARLQRAEVRIDQLESRFDSTTGANGQSPDPQPTTPEAVTSEELINAGFDPFVVDEIAVVRNDTQLQRLELRDRAIREGWIDSDRFRQELSNLRVDNQLKVALGEEDFDRLLVAEGRDNRVKVDSVISGSVAEFSGVQVNDIIFRYADDRIFTFGDLRRATSGGQRDEPVNLQIYRNDESVDLVVPRGPLGVTVSGIQQNSIE